MDIVIEQLKCKSCGASMKFDGSMIVVECEFCNSTFILKKEYRQNHESFIDNNPKHIYAQKVMR